MRHAPRTGRDVRLTINDRWQQMAAELLAGEKGGIVLLSLSDMSLRTLASAPTYDPNVLDEQFAALREDGNAPLLNRPIQGQYQPGLALEPFLLADLVNRRAVQLAGMVNAPDTPIQLDSTTLQCQSALGVTAAWSTAIAETCPAPLLRFSEQFSRTNLQTLYTNFGFYRQPELAFAVEGERLPILLPNNIERALLGQDTLTVTPLQLALAWAALGRSGELIQPHLVAALENAAGEMIPRRDEEVATQAVEAWATARVLAVLPQSTVAIEHRALAIADEQGNTTAWYLGLFPIAQPRYALVVVLEESDLLTVETLGRQFARAVLESR
jgi:peptidoglycan glycosyltransferase